MSYHTLFGTEVDHILCLVDFPSFSSDNFQTPNMSHYVDIVNRSIGVELYSALCHMC